MKLQYSITCLAILNVVCCYPSSGENESQRANKNSSISVSMPLSSLDESQVAKDNYLPEVEYPTTILDTIHPFYYTAADHADSLAPFTSDVKESFKILQAEKKVKEQLARQGSISSRDIYSDDLLVNDPSSYDVLINMSEVSCEDYLKAKGEAHVNRSDDTNSQVNINNEKNESRSEDEMEISDDTNSQFNVNNENGEPTREEEVEVSDDTNSQFSVNNENVGPAREEEVKVSDDTNSQFSVNNENVGPAREEEVEVSDDTNSQFSVNNENVGPAREEEMEISEGSNSQFNVVTDNIEPTGIPTDSTPTDDSSKNSDGIVSLDDEN